MNTKSQLFGAWCGPGFGVSLGLGFIVISHLFPPHSPTFTPAEVVAFYQSNTNQIRLGLLIFLWATAVYLPFAGVLTVQMARIEGKYPMWTAVQVMASAGNVITLTFPMAFWATAAPESSAVVSSAAARDLIMLSSGYWFEHGACTLGRCDFISATEE